LKLRFAFISTMSGVPWGGSEELWSQSALRLHQEGHDVSASVVWWPQLSSKVLSVAEQGIDIVTQKSPDTNLPVRVWRKIKNRFVTTPPPEITWLRHKRPNLVVISQGYNRGGLEWMKFCREIEVPYVAIVHCNSEIWWPEDKMSDDMALAYRAAKKVLCVSRHNLVLLENQIGESLPNAGVVWNPCNVPAGQPPAWPEENGVWKLACVARLDPAAKGQDLLLQILSQSKWSSRPVEVNIYGAGPCEQSLKKLANRLQVKNVRFRGHATDVRKIWEDNHLLLLPSRYEGLPLALVEAMWCARPAIVTDVGGNAEMCVDGETGFVASAPTLGLLEQTLETAWNRRNDWQNMGKSARIRAETLIPKDPVGDFCKQLTDGMENQRTKIENT
jgi:glycosyltransferase involved in cell wall biosynthesis